MFKFLLFLLPLIVLLYVSMIYTSEAMILLTFSFVILFVFSFFYLLAAYIRVLGKVVIPISVTDAGKPVTVQIRIRNKGGLPIFRGRLYMEVWNSFEHHKSIYKQKITKILPGENQVDFSLLMEHPGNYEVHLRSVRIYDPLGFCFITKKFPSTKSVQVMPKLHEMPVLLTHPVKNFLGDSDIYDEERGGYDNSETFQIRPYAEGDKMQSIHWKLSAKTDDLMVKESSMPKACPVVLLLDYCASKNVGQKNFGSFLEIGASMSFSMMDAGCPHYVAWYEEQVLDMRRIRIDDEESFYLFLSEYLKEQGKKNPAHIKALYDEKYRAERYIHSLRLTEKLEIFKDEDMICRLKPDLLKQQLGGVEIVL